jgi:hypothetical protein
MTVIKKAAIETEDVKKVTICEGIVNILEVIAQ